MNIISDIPCGMLKVFVYLCTPVKIIIHIKTELKW